MAAAAKVANPTSNLFALLSDDAPIESAAPAAKQAQAKKADAPAATLTPAEKAKQREAKAPRGGRGGSSQERAPRPRPAQDGNASEGAGPRGSGNRGARRAVNAAPHGHQAPAHGRAFDRQSGGILPRKPLDKRGGAGKGNWGEPVKDSLVDADTAAAVDGWGDKKPVIENSADAAKEEEETAGEEVAEAPAEDEPKQLSLEEYLKQREEAAKALAAKVGTVQVRKVENADMTGAAEPKRLADAEPAATKEEREAHTARKGTKAVNLGEVFAVRSRPIGDGEDRPRGRGRGGARGGRGGRGGDRERAPRAEGESRPPRAEGEGRPPRAEGEARPPRAEGAPRGARGARGGRGGVERGAERAARGGAERGAPRGGAPRGAKGLDMGNNRQFPSLGQ